MALIQCPECGGNISSDAKTCIHCGHPLVEEAPAAQPAPAKGAKLAKRALTFSILSALFPIAYLLIFFTDAWIMIVPGVIGIIFLIPAIICSVIAFFSALIKQKKTGTQLPDFKKRVVAICLSVALPILALAVGAILDKPITYNKAQSALEEKNYTRAVELFTELNGYKDSAEKLNECNYCLAIDHAKNNRWATAEELLAPLAQSNYKAAQALHLRANIENYKTLSTNKAESALKNRLKDPSSYNPLKKNTLSTYTDTPAGTVRMNVIVEITYTAKNSFNANVKDIYTADDAKNLTQTYGYKADDVLKIAQANIDKIVSDYAK